MGFTCSFLFIISISILMLLLTSAWKISALITGDIGQPAPVVYVSGEEVVFWFLLLVRLCKAHEIESNLNPILQVNGV